MLPSGGKEAIHMLWNWINAKGNPREERLLSLMNLNQITSSDTTPEGILEAINIKNPQAVLI
ncbi:MAG: hypothetical protein LBI30_01285 [Holosporales bacterium]|nr:hypothetical protein [Holosporales bacterium]